MDARATIPIASARAFKASSSVEVANPNSAASWIGSELLPRGAETARAMLSDDKPVLLEV